MLLLKPYYQFQITVQHPVSDWRVGDEIVIATTGLRHSQRESEQRIITAISNGKILSPSFLLNRFFDIAAVFNFLAMALLPSYIL